MSRIIFSFLILVSISCAKKSVNENKALTVIEIDDRLFDKKSDYSSLFDSFKVIKLETNEHSLMGRITKIEFYNNRFYILDTSRILYVFNNEGKFLNKLSRQGYGPEEYFELRDFHVCRNGDIKILTYNKIVTYSPEMEYIGQENFKLTSSSGREINPIMYHLNDKGSWFFMGSFGLRSVVPGKDYALYFIGKNNEIGNEFFPLTSGYAYVNNIFYTSNEKVYLTTTFGNDTIYQVLGDNLYPRYFVNFKHKAVSEKDMMGERGEIYERNVKLGLRGSIDNVFENSTFLCFTFSEGYTRKQAVYNKTSGLVQIIHKRLWTLPSPLIRFKGVFDETFYTVLEPWVLFSHNKNGMYDDFKNSNGLTDLKPEDNPVLIKFKFKN
jgi:hypothetical protein